MINEVLGTIGYVFGMGVWSFCMYKIGELLGGRDNNKKK